MDMRNVTRKKQVELRSGADLNRLGQARDREGGGRPDKSW